MPEEALDHAQVHLQVSAHPKGMATGVGDREEDPGIHQQWPSPGEIRESKISLGQRAGD